MTITRVFPAAVAVLELCAGLVYLWHRNWPLAVTWLAYGIAAIGLVWIG